MQRSRLMLLLLSLLVLQMVRETEPRRVLLRAAETGHLLHLAQRRRHSGRHVADELRRRAANCHWYVRVELWLRLLLVQVLLVLLVLLCMHVMANIVQMQCGGRRRMMVVDHLVVLRRRLLVRQMNHLVVVHLLQLGCARL